MPAGQRAGDGAVHHRPRQRSGRAVWKPHLPEQLRSAGRLQRGGHPTTTGGQQMATDGFCLLKVNLSQRDNIIEMLSQDD